MSLVTPSHLQGGGDLLALLQNPEAVKQRLEQLQSAEQRAQEIVALAGEAARIPQLLTEAQDLKDEAEASLDAAKKESDEITDAANDRAIQIRERADADAAETVSKANGLAKQAEAINAGAVGVQAAANREKEILAARKSEYDHKDVALQQRADALDTREQELVEEKKRFAKLRDLIHEAL